MVEEHQTPTEKTPITKAVEAVASFLLNEEPGSNKLRALEDQSRLHRLTSSLESRQNILADTRGAAREGNRQEVRREIRDESELRIVEHQIAILRDRIEENCVNLDGYADADSFLRRTIREYRDSDPYQSSEIVNAWLGDAYFKVMLKEQDSK